MSEPTQPLTTDDPLRERLMAALSVAEQLAATLPAAVLPDRIGTYDTHPAWPLDAVGLELRYIGRPDAADAVHAFADVIGARTRVQRVVSGQDGHPYLMVSAEGSYQAIHVYAWTSADDPAHTAPAPAGNKPDLIYVPAAAPAQPVTPQPLTTRRWAAVEETMPLTATPKAETAETAEGGEGR